jgi:hypothetical protein
MYKKLIVLASVVMALSGMVSFVSAVEIRVDLGPGDVFPGWTQWAPGGWGDAEGTTIDGVNFTIVGPWDDWRCRVKAEGSSDALTYDCVSFEDGGETGSTLTLTITNLPAGNYKIISYHNALFAHLTSTVSQTVNGGGQGSGFIPAGQDKDNCLQLTATFSVSGPGDVVTVDYTVGAVEFAWLSGFEVLSAGALIKFEEEQSGDFEYVTGAELEVSMSFAQAGQTYTVDYAAVGGTAVEGDDFTLAGTGTLVFNPGDTSGTVSINIIDDALDEDDETIIVELSNPTGPDPVLGRITQHTYTIRDERPKVGFEAAASKDREDAGVANIPLSLSWPGLETVTVDYEVTGGTATGGVDYTLAKGTLTFNVGDTVEQINIAMVDDGVAEGDETVDIALSNISRGVPGDIMEHEFTLVDPTFLDVKVDMVPEVWGNPTQAIPGTHKPGWIAFMPGGWGDLYMHDWRGIRDLGGTGLDVCITGGTEGRSGLKVYDMCMDNKAGGASPNGSPVGGPIANSWFTSVDRCGGPLGVEGSSQLGIYQLPVGTYELTLYHNLWEPSSDGSRECTKNGYSGNPIVQIHVWSFDDADAFHENVCLQYSHKCGPHGDALRKMQGFAGPDPGTNVIAIQEAFNVMPTSVETDLDVAMSVVKFWTDGSPVIIYCESGEGQSSQYIGDRAPINAFEIRTVVPELCACLGDLAGTDGFSAPDGKVDTGDMAKLLSELITGGGTAGDNYKVQSPSAALLLCGDLAGTDGFSAPDSQIDTGDMAKLLSHLITNGDPNNNYEAGCL